MSKKAAQKDAKERPKMLRKRMHTEIMNRIRDASDARHQLVCLSMDIGRLCTASTIMEELNSRLSKEASKDVEDMGDYTKKLEIDPKIIERQKEDVSELKISLTLLDEVENQLAPLQAGLDNLVELFEQRLQKMEDFVANPEQNKNKTNCALARATIITAQKEADGTLYSLSGPSYIDSKDDEDDEDLGGPQEEDALDL